MGYSLKSRAGRTKVTPVLVLSYVFDWIVILAAAVVGGLLSKITPNKRPFNLANPEISYPFVNKEKISTVLLVVCGLVIPGVVILFVSLLLVPGPTVPKSVPKSLIWRRKLWEWHMGWIGLGLSLTSAFLITNGMKNLFGKPRPDLISRCVPDMENIAQYLYRGFGSDQNPVMQLVSAGICTQKDKSILDDGFRSYPSGHSSFSSAGLIYLSLFLASKLAIHIPYLSPSAYNQDESRFSAFPSRAERIAMEQNKVSSGSDHVAPSGHDERIIAARNQSAAPPVYLLVIAIIPFFASIYIASTRYSDFRHHGFDILFGYFIGTTSAFFAFRYYHLPIASGAGWSWGPRSHDRAIWAGVGVGNYVGPRKQRQEVVANQEDVELGASLGTEGNDVGDIGQATVSSK
jgi:membrane-associated phospholipid phosphatase